MFQQSTSVMSGCQHISLFLTNNLLGFTIQIINNVLNVCLMCHYLLDIGWSLWKHKNWTILRYWVNIWHLIWFKLKWVDFVLMIVLQRHCCSKRAGGQSRVREAWRLRPVQVHRGWRVLQRWGSDAVGGDVNGRGTWHDDDIYLLLLHSICFPAANQMDGARVDQLQAFHHSQRRLDVRWADWHTHTERERECRMSRAHFLFFVLDFSGVTVQDSKLQDRKKK